MHIPRRFTRTLGWALAVLAVLVPGQASAADQVLMASGAVWKHLANGSDQGTAWRTPFFDDRSWPSGHAVLGFGQYHPDVLTVVPYGPDPSNKYITTYFRGTLNITAPTSYETLTLKLRRDDGAVVYINGAEVWRSNMPGGAINYRTLSATDASDNGTSWWQTTIAPAVLVAGVNVIAVEVHQSYRASGDLIFDFQLSGSDPTLPATVTRGPYLQSGESESVVVRWRTDLPTGSHVHVGPAPGSLFSLFGDPSLTTEHEVLVSGLLPGTRYFYAIGTATRTLAGDTDDVFFVTPPRSGSAAPLRVWVIGDSGTGGYPNGGAGARAVRNGYQKFTGLTHTDAWIMLGDNAYENGTDVEYQGAVFDTYPSLLKSTVVWPTIGNHDTAQSADAPPTLPYFNIFSLPAGSSAGGYPSGTEKYYSFDYANVHFVALDAMTSDRRTGGAMLTWLASDLAATSQPWLIAYWHHPAYSKGNHDSDEDIESIEMRENAVRLLEDYGVDLVLSAHSHTYERSYLIDGHYGASTTFAESMKKDPGDGRVEGTGPYRKPSYSRSSHDGAVYIVNGVGASTSAPWSNHPAMFMSASVLGSVVIDVNGNKLDAAFLSSTGTVLDHFTIIKGNTEGITLSPANLTFPGQKVGTSSAAQNVTIVNAGVGETILARIEIVGTNAADFGVTNACPVVLPAQGRCTITVRFTPAGTGARLAALAVTDNTSDSRKTVILSGTGAAPIASLSPTDIHFDPQLVNAPSAPRIVTLTNTGSSPLVISGIAASGTNAADFALSSNCPANLDAMASCDITVVFTPPAAGPRVAALTVDDDAAGSPHRVAVTGSGASAMPFGGTPRAIPGTIQAEDFDEGGEGVAYHDTTSANLGGEYRNAGVDIESASGGGYNVGWMTAGEWLNYTVTVAQTGTYALTVRVAASGTGGTFHIAFGGVDRTGPLAIPDTGGWQKWVDVAAVVTLTAGTESMRVVADSNRTVFGNIDSLQLLAPHGGGSTPFGGTPRAIPGTIQAEDFDEGGEGVAYHDTTSANLGGEYRNAGVDIESASGGGYNVGWMTAGEWLNYTVTVAQTGTYALTVRVAASGTGGTFHIAFGGVDRTGPLAIPDSGGWQEWVDVTAVVTLTAGTESMRVVADSNRTVFGNINYLQLSAATSSALYQTAGTTRTRNK